MPKTPETTDMTITTNELTPIDRLQRFHDSAATWLRTAAATGDSVVRRVPLVFRGVLLVLSGRARKKKNTAKTIHGSDTKLVPSSVGVDCSESPGQLFSVEWPYKSRARRTF